MPRALLASLRALALRVYRFLGPVAGSIRGELSKEELRRAAIKGMTVGLTAHGGIVSVVRDPTFVAQVVLPLALAALVGVLDAITLRQTGAVVAPHPPYWTPGTAPHPGPDPEPPALLAPDGTPQGTA